MRTDVIVEVLEVRTVDPAEVSAIGDQQPRPVRAAAAGGPGRAALARPLDRSLDRRR